MLSPRSYQVLGSFDHKILFIHFSGDDAGGFQEEGRLQKKVGKSCNKVIKSDTVTRVENELPSLNCSYICPHFIKEYQNILI